MSLKKILLLPVQIIFLLLVFLIGLIIWLPTSILIFVFKLGKPDGFLDSWHQVGAGMLLFIAMVFIWRE